MSTPIHILVPTDFSEYSNKALETAYSLAKKVSCKITVLHIIDYSGYVLALDNTMLNTITLNQMYEELQKDSEEKLKKIANSKSEQNLSIEYKCTSGLPADEILDFANENKANLIIMGTKGANNVADEILGTLTDKIVRKSKCPVLSVHKDLKEFKTDKVAIVSSFKEDLGNNLQNIIDLLQSTGSEIELARINTVTDFENTRYSNKIMTEFANKWKLNNAKTTVYNHEHFESGLYYYANEAKLDIIIMGTHGRKGLNHLYHGGSKTEDVIKRIETPVLSFRIN